MDFEEWMTVTDGKSLEESFPVALEAGKALGRAEANDTTKDLLIGRLSVELESTRLRLDEFYKMHRKMVDDIKASLRSVEHPMYY